MADTRKCVECGKALRRRDWAKVVRYVVMSVLIAIALAALMLAMDRQTRVPWEQYDLYGWYGIWFWGTYLTGALQLLAMGTRHGAGVIRRIFPRPVLPRI